jgi:hypothetical protein
MNRQILKEKDKDRLTSQLLFNSFISEFPDWQSLFPYLTENQQLILSLRLGLQKFDGTWINMRSRKERNNVVIVSFADIARHLDISPSGCHHTYVLALETLRKVKENKRFISHHANMKIKAMQKSQQA